MSVRKGEVCAVNAKKIESAVGALLTTHHVQEVYRSKPKIGWFELMTEDLLRANPRTATPQYLRALKSVIAKYPVTFHGVELSIGSTDPLNRDYLRRLKALIKQYKPIRVSDHLSWTTVKGINLEQLLPLPMNEETLKHLISRINFVQDFLGMQVSFENPATYLQFRCSDMEEGEFLSEIAKGTGCGILFDMNNLYVNSVNHGFSFAQNFSRLDPRTITQVHIAGYAKTARHLLDSHDRPPDAKIWGIFSEVLRVLGPVPVCFEWDVNISTFSKIEWQVRKLEKKMMQELLN